MRRRGSACQDQVAGGHAGVGVVSLRGAPIALPTFATAQFRRFFNCGRAARCFLPVGGGRFMHLVVLHGYQGADDNAEQLALTEQLFDAALAQLAVVTLGQPCLIVGDFNVEPTKIPCLPKGVSAGLWVDLEAAWRWPVVFSLLLPASVIGSPLGAIVGISWLAVRWLLLRSSLVQSALVGGCSPTLLSGLLLIVTGGLVGSLSLSGVLPFGLLLCYLLLMKVGVPSRWRSTGSGMSMMILCSSWLGLMHFC